MSEQFPKSLTALEAKVSESDKRLAGSLEQASDELRDIYMSFKDLRQRCVVDLGRNEVGAQNQHQVFYFQPETFLMDDPEKQTRYRKDLLKKVGQVPKPDPISYLGDELHRQMCQTVADRSTNKLTKATLAEFFKRRQYALQHMKYKLITRWAHHNLSSEAQENIGVEATYIYGKLEYNLDQAVSRCERLEQEDFYDKGTPDQRPKTKSREPGGSSLYVEKFDLKPQSLIREDDIEVYLRQVTHRNKLTKLVNKFLSRCKWLPLLKKNEIYEKAVTAFFAQKQANIERQKNFVEQISERCKRSNIMNAELQKELSQITDSYYCNQYDQMFLNTTDRLLHQWKPIHDEVPRLLSDGFCLKIKILSVAKEFELGGDIEMDRGFTYSYQVQVFFPTYFQKQVLKSQFSIYDAYVDDKVKMQKVGRMARIDTNIFRDVSTTKHTVPSDEAIYSELRNVELKIMRVKGSASWISYIMLKPKEQDWYLKQQALLNNDNPIDSLLQSGFNFLDVNDLATITRINEDTSTLHLRTLQKLFENDPHQTIKQKNVHTSDGDKPIKVDQGRWTSAANADAEQEHFLKATAQSEEKKSEKSEKKIPALRQVPGHLLTTYYSLRYLRSRDAKTKILYTLNYFRVIQKRLALDLREFASRDRIDAHHVNPFIHSTEANSVIVNQSNYKTKAVEKRQRDDLKAMQNAMAYPKMTVFNDDQIEGIKDMASLRQYKLNGMFNQRALSTCPSYPLYHAAHGEPITSMPEHEEQDRKPFDRLEANAIRLMGRVETIELNEKLGEVYVKDDFGIYIIYDCVFQDMKYFEEDLCKVGSYFIKKAEKLLDPSSGGERPFPARDRLEVIQDMLINEAKFNFAKVKLCQVYMECYEHVTDPLEQQKLMQTITDIMARRPRLNLQANYFTDAYEAEIFLLEKQFELIRAMVDIQVTLEKTENKRLQDSLNMSYFLANQYAAKKWKYQDAEDLLKCIAMYDKLKQNAAGQDQNDSSSDIELHGSKGRSHQMSVRFEDGLEQHHDSVLKDELPLQQSVDSKGKHIWGETTSSVDDHDFQKDDPNEFSKLLGLPTITLETLYMQYTESNHNILKMMGEHAHFIQIHEGYPEFLSRLTHRSVCDKNRLFKPNAWSQETGSLDFYETLDFINRYHSVVQSMAQELHDTLREWDPVLATFVEQELCMQMKKEFHRVLQFQEGERQEYAGRQLIEDEQIMGNADKMVFYAKEMISDLTMKPLSQLDPYQIAKLDSKTVEYFEFKRVPLDMNKYQVMRKGIQGGEYLIECEKRSLAQAAISKVAKATRNLVTNQPNADVLNQRNVVVPSMLTLYSNMMELHRLRGELILAVTECNILQEVYLQQAQLVGQKSPKLLESEAIIFENAEQSERDKTYVNFVDHGCAMNEKFEIAISEFDPVLTSNLNFRNPDGLKLNILTAGLEEIRAILQYQILQKHLLIVATRLNALTLQTHERAFLELDLMKTKLLLPNAVVNYKKCLNKHTDSINMQSVASERSQFKLQMSSNCYPLFYNVCSRKSGQRASIAKEFQTYLTTVQTALPFQEYPVLRVMRSFKLKLVTKFVQTALTEVYLDSQKIQAAHSCNRLRIFQRIFTCDPQSDLIQFESAPLLENYPANYLPKHLVKEEGSLEAPKADVRVMSKDGKILVYDGVPSSSTILGVDTCPAEDLRLFKQKRFEIRQAVHKTEVTDELKDNRAKDEDPEKHLKQMLPTFTPMDPAEELQKRTGEEQESWQKAKIGRSASGLLDYEEALYFGDSHYSTVMRYYQALERILTVEFFIVKMQFTAAEVVELENAVNTGMLFWKLDDFDARIAEDCTPEMKESKKSSRSYQYAHQLSLSTLQKKRMAEPINSLALTMKSFFKQLVKTKENDRFEYLTQYTEFRYQQVVGSLYRLMNQYYLQKNIKAAITVRHGAAQLTNMGHIKSAFLKPNNYSVSTALTSADLQPLDSFVFGPLHCDESTNFRRCIQPVINEKALEPSQLTLFQALYLTDTLRRSQTSQFVGQWGNNMIPFRAMEYVLLDLSSKDRAYAQSFISQAKNQANDFMETVFNDSSMALQSQESVYSLQQLIDAKKFLNETAEAVLLRNALICWYENQPLPSTTEDFDRFEANFKKTFFWKQLEQKEELMRKLQMQGQFGKIPTKEQLKELQERIDKMAGDQSLPTENAIAQRDKMVKALREEFSSLKKKVTLDQYFGMKAEITVFGNEIEKYIVQASVQALNDEHAALTKCFTTAVPKLQYHIHPFQQFAATFYDQCDPNAHLDIANKLGPVQELLTRMRNRSTEVETLTAGPGLVFSMRDINDILQDFSRRVVKFQEIQFKSRTDLHHQMEEKYRMEVYQKDQEINTLKHRINEIGKNLENIIDARLFEKGNQLIYELDSSNRILKMFKHAIGGLEHHLETRIQCEQHEKFKRQKNEIGVKNDKFRTYLQVIQNEINADWERSAEQIKREIKTMAELAKEVDHPLRKRGPDYKGAVYCEHCGSKSGGDGSGGVAGAVVPEGFEHYPSCSCYKPRADQPRPTQELAALEMLSEREAREELLRMNKYCNQQRIFFRVKEMTLTSKYEKHIDMLKKQLHDNGMIWDQLAEGEKRESVVKQELLYTQQQLSASEKTIQLLKEEIKKLDSERVRLLNFKSSQYERLKELENRCKKYDLSETLNLDKMIGALARKDATILEQQSAVRVSQTLAESNEHRRVQEVAHLRQNYRAEQARTQQMVEKMEQMKLEIKLLESNDQSAAGVWKQKCLDLFDVCNEIKKENTDLRDRCQELIQQGLELADTMNQVEDRGNSRQSFGSSLNQLPQLSKESQFKKTVKTTSQGTRATYHQNSQMQSQKYSDTASKLPSDKVNETLSNWQVPKQLNTTQKKLPMTSQQRQRTVIPSLDYTSINGQQKRIVNQDIKSILQGGPVCVSNSLDTRDRKKFGSVEPHAHHAHNTSLHSSHVHSSNPGKRVDSLLHSSYNQAFNQSTIAEKQVNHVELHEAFRRQPHSIALDLQGVAAKKNSPRSRILNGAKKGQKNRLAGYGQVAVSKDVQALDQTSRTNTANLAEDCYPSLYNDMVTPRGPVRESETQGQDQDRNQTK